MRTRLVAILFLRRMRSKCWGVAAAGKIAIREEYSHAARRFHPTHTLSKSVEQRGTAVKAHRKLRTTYGQEVRCLHHREIVWLRNPGAPDTSKTIYSRGVPGKK